MKKEYIFLVLSALFFGSINPIGKILLNEITPLQFALIRSSFGCLLILFGLILSREYKIFRKMKKNDFFICIILGIVAFFLFQVFMGLALSRIAASVNSLLLNSTIPISVLFLTFLVSHKKITKYSVLGVIFGMAGMALAVLKPEDLSLINVSGIIFAILAGIFWGVNTFGITGVRKKFGTFPILTLSLLSGVIVSFLFILLIDGCDEFVNASINMKLLFVFAGFFSTGLPLIFYYYSLKKLGAAKVSVCYYLAPVFAIILSAIILQEPITYLLVLGTFFILVGIGLVQKEKF